MSKDDSLKRTYNSAFFSPVTNSTEIKGPSNKKQKTANEFNPDTIFFFDLDGTLIYRDKQTIPPHAKRWHRGIPNCPDYYAEISILFFDTMKPVLNWVANYFKFGVIIAAGYSKKMVIDIFNHAFDNKQVENQFTFINNAFFESEAFSLYSLVFSASNNTTDKAIALHDWSINHNPEQKPMLLVDDQKPSLDALPDIIPHCKGMQSCVDPFSRSTETFMQFFLKDYASEKDRTENTDYILGSYLIKIAEISGLHQLACIYLTLDQCEIATKEAIAKISKENITIVKEYTSSFIFTKWREKNTLETQASLYEKSDFPDIIKMINPQIKTEEKMHSITSSSSNSTTRFSK